MIKLPRLLVENQHPSKSNPSKLLTIKHLKVLARLKIYLSPACRQA